MLVWGCVAHLVVMLAEAVPRWTPLWAARILALETALYFPLTFRVGAGSDLYAGGIWLHTRCSHHSSCLSPGSTVTRKRQLPRMH